MYDANLTLKVESVGTPLGNGNISIELLKEELNCKIEDTVLIDYSASFDNTSAFTYERFLDLAAYVNNNTIKQFYGKFLLKIQINGTHLFDEFKISDFYLLTDTFIQAGPEDTKGWTTNPAIKDTDGDGWNDYKEIFVYDTNPISVDMDGDGAWDPIDIDPKRDVMLEISPISASVPTERNLQIVTTFSLDSGEDYAIYSLKKSADYYQSSKWHAYFDGTHGSSMELHYYIDINDCKQTQGNSIPFNLQLWHVDRYWGFIKKWDSKLLSADRTYYIQTPGHLTQYTIYDTNYEFKVKVKTIGVEKANTIAIYDTNGTVFNGHYQEQEKMNIIQLYINDSGDGTPFEEGPNVIVIPTSLFTETIFNAHVQNETLDETPIYSADEEIFKFISVGREGNIARACDEIDFVFIRFDISSQDAMEILNLLLTCLVNETTNETAITYSYVSTKENNTSASMMNLYTSVLGFIPWFCNFSDSPQGSKPKDFDDWFWSSIKAIGKAIVGFFMSIVMTIIELVKLIIDFVVGIIMEFIPVLAYIIWLIIRVIILILIWIIFVLTLLVVIIVFILITSFILLLNIFMDLEPEISFNKVKVEGNISLSFEYTIGVINNEFLGFFIPVLRINFSSSLFQVSFSSDAFSENLEFVNYPNDLLYNFTRNSSIKSSGSSLKPSESESNDLLLDGLTFLGAGMAIPGLFVATFCAVSMFLKVDIYRKIYAIFLFLMYIATIIVTIWLIIESDDSIALATKLFGLGIGLFFASIFFFAVNAYLKKPIKFMYRLVALVSSSVNYIKTYKGFLIFAVIDFILGVAGLAFDFEEVIVGKLEKSDSWKVFTMIFSISAGILSLILAGLSIIFLGVIRNKTDNKPQGNVLNLKQEDKATIALIFGWGCLIISMIILGVANKIRKDNE
ncbi:MAG: hypothetical protein ACFFBI_04190 [Promethearchaeota archaeon]